MKIALKAPNGLFVSAEEGGGIDTRNPDTPVALRANRPEILEWETFEQIALAGEVYCALRTAGGYYVTAEQGGGSTVRTNATAIGPWERFIEAGGVFLCWDGEHYLTIEPGADPIVSARTLTPTFEIVTLEPDPEPPTPIVPPGPTDRRTFRASFCAHRDQDGQVVFDPLYFGILWNMGDRATIDACLARKVTLGLTAVLLAVQGGYHDYMGGATFDFRPQPETLAALARYVRDRGFTPIILVATADGGTEVEIYNGTMQRVCEAVKDLAAEAWFCAGYEQDLDRGGAYSAKQMDDALLLMRRTLGPDALLLLWLQPNRCTPASYWGSDYNNKPSAPIPLRWIGTPPTDGAWIEADDPYEGNEQGAYYISGGLEIDGLFYQTPHGHDGPSYTSGGPGLDQFGQPRYIDRIIECADRFLAPGTPMPGAQGHKSDDGHGGFVVHTSAVAPSLPSPDWFHQSRPRGRPLLIVGETVAYEYVRNQCSDQAVQACAALVTSCGVPVQGCWQP